MTARRLTPPPRRRPRRDAAWQALPKAREQLVWRQLGEPRELGRRDHILAVAAEQCDHVAEGGVGVRHVEHRHVHRHPSHDVNTAPRQECDPPVSKGSSISIGIPHRDRGDPPYTGGAPLRAVAHGVTLADRTELHDPGTDRGDGLRYQWAVHARRHAVQEDAGATQGPARRRAPLHRGSILGVNEWGPLGHLREGLVEARLLLVAAVVVEIRRVKVREDARRPRPLEQLAMLCDLIPAHPRTRHPRVDLQMPISPRARPRLDHCRITERGSEIGPTQCIDLRAEDRREHDDWSRDAAAAQLLALGARSDAEAPRRELLERERDMERTESVSVGLHHRQERHASSRRNRSSVAAQRSKVHLDPGACHRTARYAIM